VNDLLDVGRGAARTAPSAGTSAFTFSIAATVIKAGHFRGPARSWWRGPGGVLTGV